MFTLFIYACLITTVVMILRNPDIIPFYVWGIIALYLCYNTSWSDTTMLLVSGIGFVLMYWVGEKEFVSKYFKKKFQDYPVEKKL